MEHLRQGYVRTARRARAREDLSSAEIDESLKKVDEALDEPEREEAIRVRQASRQSR